MERWVSARKVNLRVSSTPPAYSDIQRLKYEGWPKFSHSFDPITDDVWATQPQINLIKSAAMTKISDPVVVLRINGRYLLIDGHHRWASAWGRSTWVPATVYDADLQVSKHLMGRHDQSEHKRSDHNKGDNKRHAVGVAGAAGAALSAVRRSKKGVATGVATAAAAAVAHGASGIGQKHSPDDNASRRRHREENRKARIQTRDQQAKELGLTRMEMHERLINMTAKDGGSGGWSEDNERIARMKSEMPKRPKVLSEAIGKHMEGKHDQNDHRGQATASLVGAGLARRSAKRVGDAKQANLMRRMGNADLADAMTGKRKVRRKRLAGLLALAAANHAKEFKDHADVAKHQLGQHDQMEHVAYRLRQKKKGIESAQEGKAAWDTRNNTVRQYKPRKKRLKDELEFES